MPAKASFSLRACQAGPILPVAYASSRAVTFQQQLGQDKPRAAVRQARVCAPASRCQSPKMPDLLEIQAARKELTTRLNEATERAYAIVGARP